MNFFKMKCKCPGRIRNKKYKLSCKCYHIFNKEVDASKTNLLRKGPDTEI